MVPTNEGNRYILVVADYFSKYAEAYALPDMTAQTVADTLTTQFFCRYGIPRQLHSDQGTDFQSELFREVCRLLQIEKTRTMPFRPQSDGLVERLNRTLKSLLKAFVNEHHNDWDGHLSYLMCAYRSTIQDSTRCSPNLLMLCHEILWWARLQKLPSDLSCM